MVLYLLRHEQRTSDRCDFFTNLTSIGRHRSRVELYQKLLKLRIHEIYCSPYKRTIDTIQHLSTGTDIKIKLDWALSDRLSEKDSLKYKCFPSKNEQEQLHKLYNIDTSYIPTTNIDYITSYVESDIDYEKRVDNFLNYINTNIENKNILVVSHASILNRIIKKMTGINKKIDMGECFIVDIVKI